MVKARIAHVRTEFSNDTFPMQADYLAAYQLPKGQLLGSLARAPQRNSISDAVDEPSTLETLYLRELKYVLPMKNHVLTIGREQQNMGLILEDHTVFSKSENRFNVTDLASVISYDYLGKNMNFSAHVFGPSFQEKRTNREYGMKVEGDYSFGPVQFGTGLLIGQADSIDRKVFNLNSKVKFFKQLQLMFEGVLTQREVNNSQKFDQKTLLAILSFFPLESLEIFALGEKITRDEPFEVETERLGGGFNFKLHTYLSWRSDWKRTFLSRTEEDLFISQLYLNWW